ncbi:shTK domain protein [Ostertagia ostertagi]
MSSITVIDFCSMVDRQSCGPGHCVRQLSGNRCKCPPGWMGRKCARPCQDVYRSCKRWREEERCSWTRPISPFFTDNCALSCGLCRSSGRRLPLTLPPILDNIAWFVGRWECKTTQGDNKTAVTMDGRDVHTEVGFMTTKPFKEDTGFVEFNKPAEGDDQVAIESVGNNGQCSAPVKNGLLALEY